MLRFSTHLDIGATRAALRTTTRAALLTATLALASCMHATPPGSGRSLASQGGEVGPLEREAPARSAQREISIEELSSRAAAAPAAAAPLAARAVVVTSLAPRAAFASPAVRASDPSLDAPRVQLWRGTYVGGTYAQRGALAMLLRTGPDDAPVAGAGGIVGWRVTKAHGDFGAPRSPVRDSAVLVRVPVLGTQRESDGVLLRLDTFFDPACNCTVRAQFTGLIRGDTLSGRFTIDGAATMVGEERGRWRAVRVRGTP